MMKLFTTLALISIATLWAPGALADWFCGKTCYPPFPSGGSGGCFTNGPPTTACTQWGGSYMSGSSQDCGGSAGCGFDGELCPPDEQKPQGWEAVA
jgi:hypothetical protein